MADHDDTLRWRELDRRHHLHPFTNPAELASRELRIITRAEGCWLWDSEGHRILDGMAGLWCVNVGYGRERLADAAYRQMRELPFYNTFFQCATPPAVELAARLAEIAPAGLDRVFFTNSGSEANDTAVKLVRFFWNLMGRPEKKTIISRNYAYHGVTLATASLSGLAAMHPQSDLPLPGFEHVVAPYWYGEGGAHTPEEHGRLAAQALERRIQELGPERVAAFIGEPIQGAGGVIIPPEGYWAEIQRICREHDVLLIVDEVICGFGRTGRWWGAERFGIRPDIVTAAKGLSSGYLPIAAVLLGRRVGDALVAAGQEWTHGFTYSGHPVAAAVALENLRLLEEEGLHERAGGPLGDYFATALATLADHPLVGEVRSCGLIAGIELVEDKARRRHFAPARRVGILCRDHCIAQGLVMRAVRDVMVLAPPLVISEAEIDQIVARARAAFDRTAADLGLG
ncbi:MAG TPA: aspartate aminotransferase family protein [Geminicoccaceae bacterium]|nr:aspartate aminotransferase family protein [Geminicoccaceae bacterium]